MNPPLPSTPSWSRSQLDSAAGGLPWVPPDEKPKPDDVKLDDFWAGHDEREKHRAIGSLNKRLEHALRTSWRSARPTARMFAEPLTGRLRS
jgi:hypothetical protein